MTVGLHQPIEIDKIGVGQQEPTGRPMSAPKTSHVIGVICSGDLAVHRDEIKSAISRGLVERPDAVWVCLEPKSDRMTHDVMISLDIEPVVLPLNDAWRLKPRTVRAERDVSHIDECEQDHLSFIEYVPGGRDLRRLWRDLEMGLCDEVIVFHRRGSSSPWRERSGSKLFIVEIGKAKSAGKSGRTSRTKEYTHA